MKIYAIALAVMLLLFGCGGQQYGTNAPATNDAGGSGDDMAGGGDGGMMDDDATGDDGMMDDGTGMDEGPVVIEMTAKQWEFEPSTVTVKVRVPVVLRITSVDVKHGFAINEFGVNVQNLEPGEAVDVEFTPDRTGTFTFYCAVFCGSGHANMKGTLVVEE